MYPEIRPKRVRIPHSHSSGFHRAWKIRGRPLDEIQTDEKLGEYTQCQINIGRCWDWAQKAGRIKKDLNKSPQKLANSLRLFRDGCETDKELPIFIVPYEILQTTTKSRRLFQSLPILVCTHNPNKCIKLILTYMQFIS